MIRDAVPADARGVAEVKVRAWRAAYAGFMEPALLDALDPAEETADWASYLAELPADHRLWIAGEPGRVLGFCRTGPAADDPDLGAVAAEIYGLYVEPGLIGTGLGRRLFGHAVADLEARALRPLCVYAYLPNESALRFYERAGFVRDGVTRLGEGDEDAPDVAEARLVKR
ncbi:GNAT family N-acetyltransferase [Phytomonospora sp. NPDC050363]|uniref:GNAT family N-acetyltransferase n=1 Tax=Phytomonospora sp. NPDC050363 TaxID=3155642 RepID=UPI0033F730DC